MVEEVGEGSVTGKVTTGGEKGRKVWLRGSIGVGMEKDQGGWQEWEKGLKMGVVLKGEGREALFR